MKSALRGRSTLGVEVTNVSTHGFWLLIGTRELFVPFEQFPWFRDAAVGQILSVELQGPDHLYWPDLDVDLSVQSIEHPERFPLLSRALPSKLLRPTPRPKRQRTKRARSRAARGSGPNG